MRSCQCQCQLHICQILGHLGSDQDGVAARSAFTPHPDNFVLRAPPYLMETFWKLNLQAPKKRPHLSFHHKGLFGLLSLSLLTTTSPNPRRRDFGVPPWKTALLSRVTTPSDNTGSQSHARDHPIGHSVFEQVYWQTASIVSYSKRQQSGCRSKTPSSRHTT